MNKIVWSNYWILIFGCCDMQFCCVKRWSADFIEKPTKRDMVGIIFKNVKCVWHQTKHYHLVQWMNINLHTWTLMWHLSVLKKILKIVMTLILSISIRPRTKLSRQRFIPTPGPAAPGNLYFEKDPWIHEWKQFAQKWDFLTSTNSVNCLKILMHCAQLSRWVIKEMYKWSCAICVIAVVPLFVQ